MKLIKRRKKPQWWLWAKTPNGTKAKRVQCNFSELGSEIKKMAYHVDVGCFEIDVWRDT